MRIQSFRPRAICNSRFRFWGDRFASEGASIIKWIRFRYRIPPPTLKKPDELTVHQVAQHFGVSEHVVYYWIEHALVQARKLNVSSPYWITLNESDEQKLRYRVRNSSHIHTASSAHIEGGAV